MFLWVHFYFFCYCFSPNRLSYLTLVNMRLWTETMVWKRTQPLRFFFRNPILCQAFPRLSQLDWGIVNEGSRQKVLWVTSLGPSNFGEEKTPQRICYSRTIDNLVAVTQRVDAKGFYLFLYWIAFITLPHSTINLIYVKV